MMGGMGGMGGGGGGGGGGGYVGGYDANGVFVPYIQTPNGYSYSYGKTYFQIDLYSHNSEIFLSFE